LPQEVEARRGRHHGRSERAESAQAKLNAGDGETAAVRSESGPGHRRKGDEQMRKIALRLRRKTTMTWEWMAQRLKIGAAGYAANYVR
jgi:hypothetical protein